MKTALRRMALSGLLALAPVLAACGGSGGGTHTVKLGGVNHRDGYTDPLSFCVSCHGATLHGGGGPSCYNCHNSSDHQTVRAGVRHNQPGSDCTRCHGPSRTRGGLGPACVGPGCHTS